MLVLTHHILGTRIHDIPENPEAQVLFPPPELPTLVAKFPYVSHTSV